MRKSFFALLFAFECFKFSLCTIERRIYNGREAVENEFPFIVAVLPKSEVCGGVLLNDLFVLTAGHCLMNTAKGQSVTVVLGGNNFYSFVSEKNKIELKATVFWIHENFSMPTAKNDIGIIKLPRPVKFTNEIYPVKISKDLKIDQCNKEVSVIISGWGAIEQFEPIEFLQTATLKLIPISDCLKFQSHFAETITKNHICAFGLRNTDSRSTAPCDGDSGSE